MSRPERRRALRAKLKQWGWRSFMRANPGLRSFRRKSFNGRLKAMLVFMEYRRAG